jgi:pimeloyl-ACP methyl ester carboxylesterase
MATFVLVHGAWHGGWCWSKVVPLLERAGHSAVALDLPGHGADTTSIGEVSLHGYAHRVCQVARGQAEPVILVGHSLGGVVISQAAEECPASVQMLIYLAAYLLPHGQSLVGAADAESDPQQFLDLNEANGSVTVVEEGIVPILYHDCSADDVSFAKPRLVPEALAPTMTPLHLTEANYGRVPRVYIECLQDRALTIARQRHMYTAMPCAAVFTLDAGHAPFFAAPEALAAQLIALV